MFNVQLSELETERCQSTPPLVRHHIFCSRINGVGAVVVNEAKAVFCISTLQKQIFRIHNKVLEGQAWESWDKLHICSAAFVVYSYSELEIYIATLSVMRRTWSVPGGLVTSPWLHAFVYEQPVPAQFHLAWLGQTTICSVPPQVNCLPPPPHNLHQRSLGGAYFAKEHNSECVFFNSLIRGIII